MSNTEQVQNTREILTRQGAPAGVRIGYGALSEQFGELRLPAGVGPFPVIVAIHGGCWRAMHTLDYMGHISADLTESGVATWNIEYRRLGQDGGGWPGTYQDVGNAIDHLRQLATGFPLDLRRVIVTGHSAGGHLALWAAGRRRLTRESELYAADPLQLIGVAPLAAVTDLQAGGTACDDEAQAMYGTVEKLSQTSPPCMLPLGMPVIVIHGEDDLSVPAQQAISYVEAAERSGDRPRLCLLSGADHFVIVDPRSSYWPRVKDEIISLLPAADRQ